jgi:hypothetical protein
MLRLLLAAFLVCTALAADTPPPSFPTEIKLTSGATLRATSLVRWTADGVVVKHAGGTDPVRFQYIAEPSKSQLMAFKTGAATTANAATAATKKATEITGQVFVTTRGQGAYRFSNATVYAFPHADLDALRQKKQLNLRTSFSPSTEDQIEAWTKSVGDLTPVGIAKTDASGKYVMKLPSAAPVFLYCIASRAYGGTREYNVWAVSAAGEEIVHLTGDNSTTYLSR